MRSRCSRASKEPYRRASTSMQRLAGLVWSSSCNPELMEALSVDCGNTLKDSEVPLTDHVMTRAKTSDG